MEMLISFIWESCHVDCQSWIEDDKCPMHEFFIDSSNCLPNTHVEIARYKLLSYGEELIVNKGQVDILSQKTKPCW